MDAITQSRIALLHPKLRDEATALINQANAVLTSHSHVRVVQGLRTFAEQDALFLQRPRVTKAKGGQSLHNYGVAIDFCLIIDDKDVSWDLKKDYDGDHVPDWSEVVKVFTNAGWEWGGTWTSIIDNPHLQKVYGHTWEDLLQKWNSGDTFIDTNGQKYVNL